LHLRQLLNKGTAHKQSDKIILMMAAPAMSVELFQYRGAATDGGTLEYLFEAGEQNFIQRGNQREGG
jgi:hypothetical protein